MGTLRDDLLSVVDSLRGLPGEFGLRRFSVTVRRRVWSGDKIGAGSCTNQDIALSPTPRVRFMPPYAMQMSGIIAAGGKIEDRYFKIDKITPAYFDSNNVRAGGYTPDELRMLVGQDQKNVQAVVIIIGDDGIARECTQPILEIDRAFGYSMVVREVAAPAVHLVSIAITAPTTMAPTTKQQMVATGTFSDGSAWPVTAVCKWTSSDATKATIDVTGKVTTIADGTSNIGASIGGIAATPRTLTVVG